MKVSLIVSYIQPGELAGIAVAMEQAGFHSLALGDHPVHPRDVAPRYPYGDARGTPSVTVDKPQLDPWVAGGVVAGVTTRLRFMTSVYLPLLRHPLLTAKAVATMAGASNNRLTFGVGLGWMREEFDCLDVPYEQRGARLDEILDILNQMWTSPLVEHHGTFYDFAPIGTNPTPSEPIPMYFGGHSAAMLERAARRGDGWICAKLDTMEAQVRTLRRRRAELGRENPFEFVALCGDVNAATVDHLRMLGVEHVVLRSPWRPDLASGRRTGDKRKIIEELGGAVEELSVA